MEPFGIHAFLCGLVNQRISGPEGCRLPAARSAVLRRPSEWRVESSGDFTIFPVYRSTIYINFMLFNAEMEYNRKVYERMEMKEWTGLPY